MRFVRLLAWTLYGALGVSASAHAADTWTDPFPGVRHLHRTTSNQNIHVSVIDTCAKGISFRATATGERGKRVSTFATSVGADVAVNGDFYNLDGSFQTYALSMSGGVAWPDTASKLQDGRIVFGANRMKLFRDNGIPAIEPWFKEVVSGHFTILVDGQFTGDSSDPRNPRTAVGTDANNRMLFWRS